jgi:DNA-binding NarL/FixJ family response regulator
MRVLLVEDSPIFAEGMLKLLQSVDTVTMVAWADTVEAAQRHLQQEPFDVAVLDLRLRRGDHQLGSDEQGGLSALRWIGQHSQQTRVLMLTSAIDLIWFDEAVRLGAVGYLSKDDTPDAIVAAIKAVYSGRTAFTIDQLRRIQQQAQAPLLSPRENELLQLLAEGLRNREIGDTLGISEATVKKHIEHILSALGVRNRTQAVAEARRLGLL